MSVMLRKLFLGFLCLCPGPSWARELSPQERSLFERLVLRHVLEEGGRTDYATVKLFQSSVRIDSPMGRYWVRFSDDPASFYPQNGLPEIDVSGGRIRGTLVLDSDVSRSVLVRSQGLLRSLFRADPYLHPHLRPPDWSEDRVNTPSLPQLKDIAALIHMEVVGNQSGKFRYKRGLISPTSFGKTYEASRYVSEIYNYLRTRTAVGWKKFPKVLYVLQDGEALEDIREVFRRELSFQRFQEVFGSHLKGVPESFSSDTQMITITRSSYLNYRAQVHEALTRDPEQPWVIVLDEAHHTEKNDGEFGEIFSDLDPILDNRHRELRMSGTLLPRYRSVIVEDLGGNVHGTFLSKEELAVLRRGEKLPELCRAQDFRAREQGYSAPLDGIHLVSQIEGRNIRHLLSHELYEKEARTRLSLTYYALLKEVANQIHSDQVPGVVDRGVIFVRSIDRANRYANKLSALLGAEVRPFHSGLAETDQTLDWFQDGAPLPKYLVAVDRFNEAKNIPDINLVVLLRPYTETTSGLTRFFQQIGRGGRVAPRKRGLRLHDWTLFSRHLREGLSRISIEPRKVQSGGGERQPWITLNKTSYTPLEFETRYHELFPGEGAVYSEFPYFDKDVFNRSASPYLHELAVEHSIQNYSTNWGPRELALSLARALPECIEREELLQQLQSVEAWGWTQSDGTLISREPFSFAASLRMYRAIHAIARIANMHIPEARVRVEHLNQREEIQVLHETLHPGWKSLTDPEEARTFIDGERGALGLVLEEAQFYGIPNVSKNSERLKEFMVTLLRKLPPSEARDRLENQISNDWGWRGQDAKPNAAGRVRKIETDSRFGQLKALARGYQRVYRALRSIAWLYQQSLPEESRPNAPSFERIHSFEEAQKLFHALHPRTECVALTPLQREDFSVGEDGAVSVLFERQHYFLKTPLSRTPFSPRELSLAMLDKLPVSTRREELRRQLLDPREFPWRSSDGGGIRRDPQAIDRLYRALFQVAQLYNEVGYDYRIDLDALRTRSEMERWTDLLMLGRPLRTMTARELELFNDREKGAYRALLDHAKRISGRTFQQKDSAQAMMVSVTGQFPVSALCSALLDWESGSRWGWMPNDGRVAGRGVAPACQNLYRALYANSLLSNEVTKRPSIDLAGIHLREEADHFLEWFQHTPCSLSF